MFYPLILIACLILPGSGLAQGEDRAPRIEAAWSTWLSESEVDVATLAVMRNGEIVLTAGHGTTADTALPLASLTKALTAACVARLAENGAVSIDATLGQLLDAAGPLNDVSVAQLLTHTSGIWPDSTQNNPSLQGVRTSRTQTIASTALMRVEQAGTRGTYAYNNENYALLALVIEAVTSEPYGAYCSKAIFTPLGLTTATPNSPWSAHGPWGGWAMSATDYARFAWATFGPDTAMGATPQDWPAAELGGGAMYGMGTLWREIRDRHLFWHAGLLCWDGAGDGAYFLSYGGEWLVVALYSACLDGTERQRALDAALFRAALQ